MASTLEKINRIKRHKRRLNMSKNFVKYLENESIPGLNKEINNYRTQIDTVNRNFANNFKKKENEFKDKDNKFLMATFGGTTFEVQRLQDELIVIQQDMDKLTNEKNAQIKNLENGLRPFMLQRELLRLEQISKEAIPSSGGGDCPLNTLALDFAAEVLSRTGSLHDLSDENGTDNENGTRMFQELLDVFATFHNDFNIKTWDNFKWWLQSYNDPNQIEKLLTPVFRKYYVENILFKDRDRLYNMFRNEMNSFQKTHTTIKNDIKLDFDQLQIKYDSLINSPNKLNEEQAYERIKNEPEFKKLMLKKYDAGHKRTLVSIGELDIMRVLRREESQDKLALRLCHGTALNSNFVGLSARGGRPFLEKDFENLSACKSTEKDILMKKIWDNKMFPAYSRMMSYTNAMSDKEMEQIANGLLKADLSAANYDQIKLEDQPFESKNKYGYTLHALGQGMHWVPLIKDPKLKKKWQRNPNIINNFDEKANRKYYNSKGLPDPSKPKQLLNIKKVFKKILTHSVSTSPKATTSYGVDVSKPHTSQQNLVDELSALIGSNGILGRYKERRGINQKEINAPISNVREKQVEELQDSFNKFIKNPNPDTNTALKQAVFKVIKEISLEPNKNDSELNIFANEILKEIEESDKLMLYSDLADEISFMIGDNGIRAAYQERRNRNPETVNIPISNTREKQIEKLQNEVNEFFEDPDEETIADLKQTVSKMIIEIGLEPDGDNSELSKFANEILREIKGCEKMLLCRELADELTFMIGSNSIEKEYKARRGRDPQKKNLPISWSRKKQIKKLQDSVNEFLKDPNDGTVVDLKKNVSEVIGKIDKEHKMYDSELKKFADEILQKVQEYDKDLQLDSDYDQEKDNEDSVSIKIY